MGEIRKCVAGMSGGVDSSVTALLLKEQGFQVQGLTLLLHTEKESQDIADARTVCDRVGIPHLVVDGRQIFREKVMEHFARVYEMGGTPNPCVDCNKNVKIPLIMEAMEQQDATHIATGHYVRVEQQGDRFLLKKALDLKKDQSYVLYNLTQRQLSHLVFPLGGLSKPQVREIAQQHGFSVASKSDSQDICFVPDGDYGSFLERYRDKIFYSGDFVDEHGTVLGRHAGAIRYTLGQRRGLGVPAGSRLYVVGKDMEKNTVTLGANERLFSKTLFGKDLNLIACDHLTDGEQLCARIRYQQKEQPCRVYETGEGTLRVEFLEPQRAIAPGQAVVLYDGDTVVGGATITGAE